MTSSTPSSNDVQPLFHLISDGDHHPNGRHHANSNDYGINLTSFLVAADSNLTDDDGFSDGGVGGEMSNCCESGYERIIVPVIFCIVVVSGCVGNLLVLVVVVRNREQFTSTTNLFIVNLAVADLFFLIFCVPFHAVIYTTLDGWPFGDALCKLVHFVQFASMTASVYTLVAMSLDRFLAVGYPLRTKHLRTPPCALTIAVAVWTASAVLASPWSIVFTVIEYNLGVSGGDGSGDGETGEVAMIAVCADDWSSLGRRHRPTAYLVLFIVGYAIPLLSIGVLSALTVRQLWATETTNDGPSRRRSVIAKRRVTRLIAVVVSVFAVCWLPSHVVWLWTNYFPSTWRHAYPFYYGKIASHVLSYANSSMNPIIYAFLSSRFRREFRRAIRCRRPGRGVAGVSLGGSQAPGGGGSGIGTPSAASGVGRMSIVPGRRDMTAIGGGGGVGSVTLEGDSLGYTRSRCYHFHVTEANSARPTSGKSTTFMLTAVTGRCPGSSATAASGNVAGVQRRGNNRNFRHDDEDDDAVVF